MVEGRLAHSIRVLIAGGGIAALEALAGLRALAGDRIEATLLAPDPVFSYRPLSGAVPFSFLEERSRSLADLAEGLGGRLVRDGLALVDEDRSRVLTHDGDFLRYDALLVAVGATVADGRPGRTVWTRGSERSVLAPLLRALEGGAVRSVAFVIPRDASWPVDAYELALVARRVDAGSKVFLVTAEEYPLEMLGSVASEAVREELVRAGVELLTGVEVRDPEAASDERGGDAFSSMVARISQRKRRPRGEQVTLQLEPVSALSVDRAVFLPAVHGPRIRGLEHDDAGFLEIDGNARVAGSASVYAAGDVTTISPRHSTSAANQADAAAESIAAGAGADLTPTPWSTVLHGILALPPHFPGAQGSPWLDGDEPVAHCLWWPPGHVSGRHLASYLAEDDPGVEPGLHWHPDGLPLAVPIRAGHVSKHGHGRPPSEEALRHDAMTRQTIAMRRLEREGEHVTLELERRRAEFERHEREVVKELRAAGYLTGAVARASRTPRA
jgi:sulfide:quinone oxidoreductase